MGLFDKKAEACIAFVGKYGEEGAAITRSREREQLRDALCAFLAENYGVTEPEPHPDCILDNGGVFYILCRVTASKQALGL